MSGTDRMMVTLLRPQFNCLGPQIYQLGESRTNGVSFFLKNFSCFSFLLILFCISFHSVALYFIFFSLWPSLRYLSLTRFCLSPAPCKMGLWVSSKQKQANVETGTQLSYSYLPPLPHQPMYEGHGHGHSHSSLVHQPPEL